MNIAQHIKKKNKQLFGTKTFVSFFWTWEQQ